MASQPQSQAATDLIAQRAVSLVRDVVLNQLQWLFREQDVSDYGVDAHVEVLEAGMATGHLLALQIKGGASAFQDVIAEGWLFPVKSRHANYWLGHSLPVVLVLVDLEARLCYWQSISSATLISTGKNFKILVPRTNELSLAAGSWKSLTTRYLEDARLRYESYKTVLPPSVVRRLDDLWESFPSTAGMLATDLAAGRSNPAAALQELIRSRADWLDEQGPAAWLCLVNFAVEHGLHEHAAGIFQRLSELRPERRATDLANAAIQLFGIDAVEGRRLALAARELEPDDSTVIVASAALGLDEEASLVLRVVSS